MKIVRAHLDDAKELVALHDTLAKQHAFVPTVIDRRYEKEWMEFWLRDERRCYEVLLAKHKGKIVGNFWIGHMDDQERAHNAGFGVAVLDKYVNKGVGTALLQKAEKWARKQKCRQIRARVVVENERAVFFFLKRGFTFEALKQQSYGVDGRYLNENVLIKRL